MTGSQQWFAFCTHSRAEKRVAKRLSDLGYEVYLPIYIERHKWSDRIKEVEIPLFKGHIFIKCTPLQFNLIRLVQGIADLAISTNNQIEPISDKEIEEIKRFLRLTDEYKILNEWGIQKIFKKAIPKEAGEVLRYKNRYMYIHIRQCRMTMYADTFKMRSIER